MGSFAWLWQVGVPSRSARAFRVVATVVVVVVVMLSGSVPLFAQLNTGRLSGRVTDQTGGAISSAKVTVTEVATGQARSLDTDSSGSYAAPNLTPGVYTVRAEFMGFQTFERQNIEVGTGSDVRVDVTLQPGAQTQTVTVTESLPLINTTNAQTGGTLQQNLLANIPVNGRNYRWLIEFVPGIMTTPGEGTTSSSTNGGGTDWANFMIDGLYDQSPYSKQSSVGGAGEAGDTTLMPLDAIQEVALITNPKAEYGWDPGVTMNVNLKSGTNNMHGSAYAFGRDQALDARNAFSSDRQPVQFEQWGATLGGPIKKDRIFYFAGYESERLNVSSDFSITGVPTMANIPGDANFSIPQAIAGVNAAAGLSNHPVLNQLSVNMAGCDFTNAHIHDTTVTSGLIAACANGNQYGAQSLFNNSSTSTTAEFNFPQFGGSDNLLGKIDYHLSDHHSLSGSYFFGRYHEYADASTAITQPYWDERLAVRSQDVRGVEIWTPNSSWLNEARVGWDHDSRPVGMADCSVNGDTSDPLGLNSVSGQFGGPNYKSAYNLVSGAPACGLPTIKLNGLSPQLGFGNNRSNFESDWQGADTVSYTRGNHQFKFGVDVRAESFNGVKVQDSQRGTAVFGGTGAIGFTGATALESFLAGTPSQETIKLGDAIRTVRYNMIAGFVQDDWRLLPRLTLNLGLRWEVETGMKDDNGLLANFDPSQPSGMVQNNQLWPNQNAILPHVGFAWDVTGKGTTTVRSSAGLAQVVPQVQNWITSQTDDMSAMPTGATLFYPNNVLPPISPVGTINNVVQTLLPTTAGGVVTTSLPWVAGSNLFSNTAAISCGNPQPCLGYAADPHVKFPEMLTWNLNIQHAFTNTLSLDMGYIGSHAWDITGLYNINQATPGPNGSGPEKLRQPFFANCPASMGGMGLNPSQCFPWFSNIAYIGDAGGSNYAALQAYLNERPTHGLTFTVGYTLSHALGIQGGPGTGTGSVLNVNCPRCEYGDLNTDSRHHFTLTGSYNIPGHKAPAQLLEGWSINSSYNYLSPLPINVLDSSLDTSGTESLSTVKLDRWTMVGSAKQFDNIIGGAGTIPCFGIATSTFGKSGACTVVASAASYPAACISGATAEPSFPGATGNSTGIGLNQLNAIGCYFVNGAAMVPPAQGTYGNMSRNALRGKPFGIWNASVTKDFKIKEKVTAQFRAEFFNLINTTLYAAVGANLGSPKAFGAAASTPDVNKSNPVVGSGGPREIQLGLKFLF